MIWQIIVCLETDRIKRNEYVFLFRIDKGILKCKSDALQLSKPERLTCLIIPEFNASHQVRRCTFTTLIRKLICVRNISEDSVFWVSWQGVTSQKTSIFSNTAVRTSNLVTDMNIISALVFSFYSLGLICISSPRAWQWVGLNYAWRSSNK
jgi:hypothetical protein